MLTYNTCKKVLTKVICLLILFSFESIIASDISYRKIPFLNGREFFDEENPITNQQKPKPKRSSKKTKKSQQKPKKIVKQDSTQIALPKKDAKVEAKKIETDTPKGKEPKKLIKNPNSPNNVIPNY